AGPRVVVERAIDPASPIDLVVHERAVSAEEAAATSSAGTTDANVMPPDLVLPEVSASGDHDAVSLHFGDSRVHIAGGPDRRFAYWVDPRWSGPDRTDRVVHIVATPGVRVDEWNLRPAAPFEHRTQPARRLVPLVLRVQDPGRVPPQGTAIDPAGYVDQVELTGATVTTGAAGVTVSDDYLGATLSLRAADPTRGARWAYQVEPTRRELRVLVGPGVVVDVREVNRPMPGDRDDPYSDFGLRVLVYQAHDERTIPAQGTPLPRPVLEALGRPRQPDVHRFPAPSRGELALRAGLGATRTGVDFGVGFVPGLGELTDAAEAATGVNKWGERLSAGERVLTAVAAALPFVAGATMVRASRAARAADAARDAGATLRELAELVGRSHDEVEAIVHGVHRLDPDDQVAVRRVLAAFQGGGPFNPEDLVRVRSARLLSGDAPAGLSASAAPFDGPGRAWHVPADDLGPVLGRSRRHGGEVERASAGADAAARADGRRYQIQHGRGDQTELHEQVAPVRGLADDAALPALLDDLMQASPHGADQAAAEAALIGHARDRGYLVQGSIEPRRLAEVEAALGADRAQVLLVMLSRGQRAVPGTSAHLVDQLARARALPEQHAHVQGSVPLADVLARLAETKDLSAEQRAAQIGVLEAMVKSARASKKQVVLHDASPPLGGRTRGDGTVAAPGTTTVSSDGADGAPLGILEEMLTWKRSRQAGEQQKERFGALTKRYQHAITMHKPAHARYDELVVTGDEFFTRYSMITEHGLAPAEVAARRASASQLGMQELRYSADAGDLATIRADAAAVVRDRPPGVDVSLTMATTKNRTAAESPARNEQASMRRFVDAWHDEPDLQAAFSGLDSAGVEHAARTPATLWEAAAVRALRNAASLQDGLRGLRPEQLHGLAERLARIRGVDPRAARGVLDRLLLTPVDAALAEVDQVASVARATDDALRAQRAAERARLIRAGRDPEAADLLVERKLPWRPFVPGLSPAGAGRPAPTFATVSVEELSHDARSVSEALALLRAETGQAVPAPAQLGLTVHAGEQLRNPGIDAFGLLDQVDHTLALGADRIGHGVILAVDPAVLIAEGLLPAGRAHEFAARQRALVAQVRARGITVEANLSSNAEISNLTQHQHPALRLLDDNLRVSVSTDDETVLAVTVQTELERFARTPGASRAEVAAVVLEGFRSRMGHRRLAGAAHLHQALRSSLLAGLTRLERAHLVDSLATRFHVATSSNVDQTLDRLLTTILGG
nr:hypothetical protein [Kofleriaceae bacterium]